MESIEKLRYYLCHGLKHRDELIKLTDEIEREIAEKYMLLPVDKHGEVIHIGDTVEKNYEPAVPRWTNNWGRTDRFEVVSVCPDGVFGDDDKSCYANECWHVKPNPIKELLEEYAGKRFARSNMGLDIEGLADDYAAKIREAVSEK